VYKFLLEVFSMRIGLCKVTSRVVNVTTDNIIWLGTYNNYIQRNNYKEHISVQLNKLTNKNIYLNSDVAIFKDGRNGISDYIMRQCTDRRRRSGAQTSGTDVELSRTGRRSVRVPRRTPHEWYYYLVGHICPNAFKP